MRIEWGGGKNGITQGGKLYSVAATRLAEALVSGIEGVREPPVLLVSRIGTPIEEPQVVHVRLRAETPGREAELAPRAREITRHHLAEISALWELLLSHNLAMDRLGSL